ncbi:ALG11 [Candida oxycetoniae]|uniref:GDP-Man:Man(3)GlcNAc(2)-PP-Dol alpha-1,2-mannosyltransferase n=1 Tax=Candida oxycetoniae TaxID=497107 RepID=A0AAI9WWT3_9ASCO|nr:ALG11 [Candida oxycetoniae]KAI3403054.2 ALG11 [Candida oxycetoniae]
MWLILSVLLAIYFLRQLVNNVLPHFFLVPPQRWQDKFLKVISHQLSIYVPGSTLKRSSLRRRLILASSQPSFHTNFINNKLKLTPEDKSDSHEFMAETRKRDVDDPQRKLLFGFFHPYANNGGGGERVLWQAVKATLSANKRNICVIYTTNLDSEPLQIINKVKNKFQIDQLDSSRIVFIYLRKFGYLIDASYWKHFTILGQFLGTFLLSIEACFEVSPDVWVDTMGLPSSYLIAGKVLKIPIVAYVHYPILQTDMFNKLKYKSIVRDIVKIRSIGDFSSYVKLIYWSALYYIYIYLGSLVDITLTNGTWTYRHLSQIWIMNKGLGNILEILYPPCGTEFLTNSSTLLESKRENKLLYLAQFRPEKRHSLILKEYRRFLSKNYPNITTPNDFGGGSGGGLPTIVFAGSCRTKDDTATLESLRSQVDQLKLNEFVEFEIDISYARVVQLLSSCKFGLNAMWNEHFGIGVVEYMARGCIPIVHASAGPYLDIVTSSDDADEQRGFFFKSIDDPDFDPSIQDEIEIENGELIFDIQGSHKLFPTLEHLLTEMFITKRDLLTSDAKLSAIAKRGQKILDDKFSNKTFEKEWIKYLEIVDSLEKKYRNEKRDKLERVY